MVEVPKVFAAIHAVMKDVRFEADGTLPNNMGAGKYISAVEQSGKVKDEFVKNSLILVPNETNLKHEVIVNEDGRKTIFTVTRGEYQIIHVGDGSSVTFSGIGEGTANSTAIASNIASTFALKNALQRLLFSTEASLEDKGHEAPPAATAKATPPERRAGEVSEATVNTVKGEIMALLKTKNKNEVVAKGNEFFGADNTEWAKSLTDLQKWKQHLTTGEV